MSAHVTSEQLDRLRAGGSPAAAAEAGHHAATCDACREALEESLAIGRRVRDVRDQLEVHVEHLSPDALMAVADGEGADAHLEECEICRGEVEELRRLNTRLRRRPRWPLYAVAAAVAAVLFALPWLVREPDPPAPMPRRVVATPPVNPPPPSTPVAAGYARAEWDGWVAETKRTRRLAVPAIVEELRPRSVILRGAPEEGQLHLRPSHVVIAERRPRFTWAKRDGATYNVILQTGDGIVESGPLTANEWRSPVELKRGQEYTWQVEVTAGETRSLYPRAPEEPARFRVVDQDAVDEIAAARERHPDDFLLHAVIQARHGLREEALASLEQLAARDPVLAEALRASLRAWLR